VAAANIDESRQVVSPTYNSPIGLYSSGNIQDALKGQLKGLIHNKQDRWMLQNVIIIWNITYTLPTFCQGYLKVIANSKH